MRVEYVEIRDLRNYSHVFFSPLPGRNVLLGENASGKTSVIEAIFLGLCGYSFRTSREEEMVRFGAGKGVVRASVIKQGVELKTGVELKIDGKNLFIDGRGAGVRDFPGNRSVLLFRPEDLEIVTGTPAERRRFMDRVFSGIVPGYQRACREYYRALEQRNALLRLAAGPPVELTEFLTWTESLVESGSVLYQLRMKGLGELAPVAAGRYRELTGKKLAVRYLSTVGVGEGGADVEEKFYQKLSGLKEQEGRLKQTMAGPHRDDYILLVEGSDLRRHGSRGEQRTAVLSLKLAEAAILEERANEQVIYLLDDVFSELDRKRRKALLESTEGRQSFITTAEPALIADEVAFVVRGGQITRVYRDEAATVNSAVRT